MNIKELKNIIKDLPDDLEIDLCHEEWEHSDAGTSYSFEKSESLKSVHLIKSPRKKIKKIMLSTTFNTDLFKGETSILIGDYIENKR